MRTSIPYSQALRMKRICSKITDFEYLLQELRERLVNQGCNKKSVDQHFSKVKPIDRNKILKEKTHDKETKNKSPLVLTYNLFFQALATLFERTGICLILIEHFKCYSKKSRLWLLKEIEI